MDKENYTAKYQVTLWDHFLQHLRGYKPFITKITFYDTNNYLNLANEIGYFVDNNDVSYVAKNRRIEIYYFYPRFLGRNPYLCLRKI